MEIYGTLGRLDQVRALLRNFPQSPAAWSAVATRGYLTVGDTVTARRMLRELEERRPVPVNGLSALGHIYLSFGDTSRALDAFERATEAGESWPTDYSLSEFQFDPLRRSARFARLVRRLGLDVRTFTSPTGGRP